MKNQPFKAILIIAGAVVLSIAIVIFLPNLLHLFAKDIPPINDSDIILKKINVPDHQNAYFDLRNLDKKVIYEPEGKSELVMNMATGKAWDETVAREIVARNTEAFGYFAKAARKPKFQDPAFADPENISPYTVLPPMDTWRRMARLSAIRAVYLANQGKDKEAMGEALNSVKIGQKIQESQASIIGYLTALRMKGVGLEAVQRVAHLSRMSSSDLTNYARALNAFYENEGGLINAFKGEYHTQLWIINGLAEGNEEALREVFGEAGSEDPRIVGLLRNNYYFQPNKTKLLFAERTRADIKNVNQPCGEIKETDVPRLAPIGSVKLYATENAIGKILHDSFAGDLTTVIMMKCEEDLLVAVTQAILAIKAYKNDTGNYPATLSDLIPRYLASVPIDPFDGKALKYSPAKKIVYSVGRDLQDNGGSTGDDWRRMPDPTFRISL
jgi:hypothetical protein